MKIVFLNSSDIHGYILPTDYQQRGLMTAPFGLSRVKTVIEAERAKYGADHVIVTDAGDCLQGSPLAAYTHHQGIAALKTYTDFYNSIGYDARCLGNHDFNFGLSYLRQYLANNNAPFLTANIWSQLRQEPTLGQAACIVEKSGVKIGLIGVTTQRVPAWEPAENVAGLEFVSAFDQVKKIAQFLRPQVDLLAVLYHGGFEANPLTGEPTEPATGENEAYRMLTQIPAIDVFLTGHQHQKMSLVTRQTAIVQPGYRGETVGKVVVDFDEKKRQIKSLTANLIETSAYNPAEELLRQAAPLNQATEDWLDQPLAHLATPAPLGNANWARLHGAPFINLLQQMQLTFTGADISATAVMSETASGFGQEVTMRDILLNYPYANQLCRVHLTGQELRQIIEYSLSFLQKNSQNVVEFAPRWQKLLFNFDVFYPVEYQAEISRPAGQRLTKLALNGQPIQAEQIYHLAVNNYRAMGGGFYPAYSLDKIETILDQDYVQMFEQFLSNNPPVDQRQNYHFN